MQLESGRGKIQTRQQDSGAHALNLHVISLENYSWVERRVLGEKHKNKNKKPLKLS